MTLPDPFGLRDLAAGNAEAQGARAARQGAGPGDNPFHDGSAQRLRWERSRARELRRLAAVRRAAPGARKKRAVAA